MFPSVSNSVSPLLILEESEIRLVKEIEQYLDSSFPEENKLVKERFKCLQGLGEAISQYPSVRIAQKLRGIQRSEESLLEVLSSFSSTSRLFHIPTRVVAIRGFLVAKFHAFSHLSLLVQDIKELYIPLRHILFSIICTLMAEDVYFSCLKDDSLSKDSKIGLVDDLIVLWESGRDPRSTNYLSALEALWVARDAAPPSFGTMQGASELIRISIELEEGWRDFLVKEAANEETQWALEEFLFGLSYEEILQVRSKLDRFGISAVGRDEIHSYIDSRHTYGIVKDADPRAIYDFYIDRRDAAIFRQRSFAPGPKKTLEGVYLKYLMMVKKDGAL